MIWGAGQYRGSYGESLRQKKEKGSLKVEERLLGQQTWQRGVKFDAFLAKGREGKGEKRNR